MFFLFYRGDELVVHNYLNASFQSDIEKKNPIGLYFTLNNDGELEEL
jgi:hypothetical protein